jgi:hypothetical protein
MPMLCLSRKSQSRETSSSWKNAHQIELLLRDDLTHSKSCPVLQQQPRYMIFTYSNNVWVSNLATFTMHTIQHNIFLISQHDMSGAPVLNLSARSLQHIEISGETSHCAPDVKIVLAFSSCCTITPTA